MKVKPETLRLFKSQLKKIEIKGIIIPFICSCLIILSFLYVAFNDTSNRLFSSFINHYRVGDLVSEDIYSPITISFIDNEKTEAERQKATINYNPIFFQSFIPTQNNISLGNEVFDLFLLEREEAEPRLEELGVYVSSSDLDKIYGESIAWRNVFSSLGKDAIKEVVHNGLFDENQINDLFQKGHVGLVVRKNDATVSSNKEVYVSIKDCYIMSRLDGQLYSFLSSYKGPSMDFSMPQLICSVLTSFLEPNILYDEIASESKLEEIKQSVSPVVTKLQKGDLIIQKDTIVTEKTINLLEDIAASSSNFSIKQIVVIVVFMLAIMIFSYLVYFNTLKNSFRRRQFINLAFIASLAYIAIVVTMESFMVDLLNVEFDLLIPQFFIPLLIYNLTGNRMLGIEVTFMISSIMSFSPSAGPYAFIRYFASGFLSVVFLYYTPNRVERVVNYILVLVLDQFISIVSLVMEGYSFSALPLSVFVASVVFLVGQILVIGTTIILERVLNLATPSRLNELLRVKSPLLEKFEQACPGSFDHAQLVEKLASAASDALSLNTPLVILASRYHDVGKMEHPLYFVENQVDENKHDAISSELSASMIRSHVSLGVKKVEKAKLPREVIDIVAEHHGNDTINYFYYEAQRNAEAQGGKKTDISESDFAYSQLPPQTKEAAIVMLADISEAATRSAKKSMAKKGEIITEDIIRKVVHSLIMAKLDKGQLSSSGLTVGELIKVEDVFISKLTSDNHNRVEYKKD